MKEHWIVNPFSKEVMIYRFADWENAENVTFRLGETAQSFIFEGCSGN